MALDNFRTQKIIWDKANKKIFEAIEASSGDSNGRKLVVQVINQEVTEGLSGTTLSLGWKYRKGAKGLDAFKVVDASKGIFEIYYTTEMLSNIGNIEASLILIDSTGRIESSTFTISVRPSTVDDESVESENSFTALTEALVKVSDLEGNYAPRLNEVTAQLAQTPTYGTVWNMGNMGQDIKEAMTGGSVAVVGENAITPINLTTGAVNTEKIDNTLSDLIGIEKLSLNWVLGVINSGNINVLAKQGATTENFIVLDKDVDVYFLPTDLEYRVYLYNLSGAYVGFGSEWLTSNSKISALADRKVRIAIRYKDLRLINNHLPLVQNISIVKEKENSLSKISEKVNGLIDGESSSKKIPVYWENHLDTKINQIKTHQRNLGSQGTSFVFYTDGHWDNNSKNSPMLVKKVVEECEIPIVLDGGDIAANPSGVEKQSQINEILDYKKQFSFLSNRVLRTVGNHDDNSINDLFSKTITNSEMYDILYRQYSLDNVIVSGGDGSYFYADDQFQKIRYISLNSLDIPYIEEPNDKLLYGAMTHHAFRQKQIDWFADVALDTPNSGWSVVVFSHIPINQGYLKNDNIAMNILQAYKDKSTYEGSGSIGTDFEVTKNVDFSNSGGDVICWLAGHLHLDSEITLPEHITYRELILLNDSLHSKAGAPVKTLGTNTENAFSVFTIDKTNRKVYITRIGAGSDRVFSY